MNFTPIDTQLKKSLGPFDFMGPAQAKSPAHAGDGVASAHTLQARLFGAAQLSWRGAPIELSSHKGWALLCLLAVRPEGVAREELARLLWGEGKYGNLRQALYQLRQLPGAQYWLLDGGERVRVAVRSDLNLFRAALRAGNYRKALALSDAPLLADLRVADVPAFSNWLKERRAALEEERRTALRADGVRLERSGDLLGALGRAQTLIQLDPFDEVSHRAVMRLRLHQGDFAAAAAQFAECRYVLSHVGAEPRSETLELAHRIEQSRGFTPTKEFALPPQLLSPPRLVGRQEVWSQMAAAQRAGQMIFLEGEAGVGKTRLLRDFTKSLGRYALNEARPSDGCSPYIFLARGLHRFLQSVPEVQAHLCDWERMALARLLPQHFPEHALGFTPSPLDTPDKYLRFTEAVTSLFKRMQRSVAALGADDIHYSDQASYLLGTQVVRQLMSEWSLEDQNAATRIVAYRPDAMPASFRRAVAAFVESGVGVRIQVEPLSVGAVGELVESLELPGGSDLAERLHRYAHGNPMLTLETLKSMMSRGDLDTTHLLDLGKLESSFAQPNQARALIHRRLETLSESALRVARASALTQVEDVPVLADLTEMTPLAVAEGLGELQRAQILVKGRLVHDLLREALLKGLPETQARTLHERAAHALEGGKPECVAYHWLKAGKGAKAAPYLLKVAHCARQMRADQEARLRYFQVLWCTSGAEGDKALRSRALRGLSTLADLTYDLTLKAAVLEEREPSRAWVAPPVSLSKAGLRG